MSNTIYQGQSDVVITLDTGLDMTGATVHKILYHKPDGSKGQFATTVSTTNLIYTASAGDFAMAGTWLLQAFSTIAGLDNYGDPVQLNVLKTLS